MTFNASASSVGHIISGGLKGGFGTDPWPIDATNLLNSRDHLSKGSPGLGWSHSFDIRVKLDSDGFLGMGKNSATAPMERLTPPAPSATPSFLPAGSSTVNQAFTITAQGIMIRDQAGSCSPTPSGSTGGSIFMPSA